jgi:hypothetical protein
MKIVKKIIPALIMLFGLIHLSFAFPLNNLEIDTLLFIGAGLAIVFAGVINLIALMSTQSIVIKFASLVCNAIMFSLFVICTTIIMDVQVFAGIFLFLISTLFAIADLSTSKAA